MNAHESENYLTISRSSSASIKKCQNFLGRDISGMIFFKAESSLIQSNCRSLRNLKS
jgi:hypothetical protein